MDKNKSKNILVINGIFHGHFAGTIEIVQQLLSWGYNVTCYVLDTFAERIKDIGAKIEVLNIDRSDFKNIPPNAPKMAVFTIMIREAYDAIFTLFSKDKTKYDYLLIDSFFEYMEMNKIFKFPPSNIITIYTAFCLTDQKIKMGNPERRIEGLKPISMKYNINLHDYIDLNYNNPNTNNKIILTSRLFHLRGEEVDNSYFFIGPSIDKRKEDKNFTFKKDPNKKLIYISLGTIYNENKNFYSLCIEIFRNSEKYQVLMAVGNFIDIKELKDIPNNFSIFNYVPQHQVLKICDIFITHGAINSIQEGLYNHVPLIAIPQQNDQFDSAKRLGDFDAGIVLDPSKLNAEIIRNAVNTIDSNREKYKKNAEKIIESFEEARSHRKEIFEKLLA